MFEIPRGTPAQKRPGPQHTVSLFRPPLPVRENRVRSFKTETDLRIRERQRHPRSIDSSTVDFDKEGEVVGGIGELQREAETL